MAKQGTIHSNYREIRVIMLDGTEFKTRAATRNDVLTLDIDPTKHPAWNQSISNYVDTKNKQVEGFNDRFQGMSFLNV
jgi:large subunit ribosomal protein L31